jgi:hypothetical protein
MSENKIKEKTEVEKPKETAPPKRKTPSTFKRNMIRFMNMFGFFNRNQIVNAMPFILFITVLIIGYIANSYYAEHIIREIDKKKTDLKEKRAQYISIMSRLMYQSNQSEVAKALEPYQVKENTEPPDKIFIKDKPAQ